MTREKALEKITKLLNVTTEKGASENEAILAAIQAQKLMALYDVEITDIGEDSEKDEIVESSFVTGTGAKWKYTLAQVIAKNFCCKVFTNGRNTIVFYGYKKNADVAREVFKFLFTAGNRFASNHYMRAYNKNENTKGIRNAFLDGYVSSIREVFEKQCTALMLVIPDEVNDAYNIKFANNKKVIRTGFRKSTNEEHFNEGKLKGRDIANARYIEG